MPVAQQKSSPHVTALFELILEHDRLVAALEKTIQIDSAKATDSWAAKFTQNNGPNGRALQLLQFISENKNPPAVLQKIKEFFTQYFNGGGFDADSIKGVFVHQIVALPPNSKQFDLWAAELVHAMIQHADEQIESHKTIKPTVQKIEKKTVKHNKQDAKKAREEWLVMKKTPNTLQWVIQHKEFLVHQLDKILLKSGLNPEAPGMPELQLCRDNINHKKDTKDILLELQKFLRTKAEDLFAANSVDNVKGRFFEMLGVTKNMSEYHKGPALVERRWEQQVGHVINRVHAQPVHEAKSAKKFKGA